MNSAINTKSLVTVIRDYIEGGVLSRYISPILMFDLIDGTFDIDSALTVSDKWALDKNEDLYIVVCGLEEEEFGVDLSEYKNATDAEIIELFNDVIIDATTRDLYTINYLSCFTHK